MSEVLDLLNEQMNFEFESAYIYKAMSAFTDDLDLEGFTKWLDIQVEEEVMHGEGMRKFLQSIGYKPHYKALPEPKDDYRTILEVIKTALDHEKEVTQRITEISDKARDEDARVFSFIQWYIDEQVEEEDNFTKMLTRLERVGDDWHSIYMLDQELGQRGPAEEPQIANIWKLTWKIHLPS